MIHYTLYIIHYTQYTIHNTKYSILNTDNTQYIMHNARETRNNTVEPPLEATSIERPHICLKPPYKFFNFYLHKKITI